MKTFIPFCLIGLAGICQLKAATINLGVGIFNGGELKDNLGNFLPRGVANVSGDGAVLQVGYYSLATQSDPFLGQWIAITGLGTPYATTIGDSGYPAGQTKTIAILVDGSFSFVVPAVGTPLALRFYDNLSMSTSTYYNSVAATDGSFNWVAPIDPQATTGLTLPSSNIVWQDGSGSAYRTTIAIPEPSVTIILTFTAGLLATRRRRTKSID